MDEPSSFVASFDDPRVTPQFCRHHSSDDGSITLVGVVHDHPASIARVETILERHPPDVLALELPPAALALYKLYARDSTSPPRFGGEMSAAIRAAAGADVVGIDAPSWAFVHQLFGALLADRAPLSTVRRVVSSLGGATRAAVTCRLAATLNQTTAMTVAYREPISYDCDHTDPPERQAAHERSHVSGVQALLHNVDDAAVTYRDETRERCMIERLESERVRGDLLAVVGVDHLEALENALFEE